MSNNIICPHCKKKISIPREAKNWMELGEDRIIRKIYAILSTVNLNKTLEDKNG